MIVIEATSSSTALLDFIKTITAAQEPHDARPNCPNVVSIVTNIYGKEPINPTAPEKDREFPLVAIRVDTTYDKMPEGFDAKKRTLNIPVPDVENWDRDAAIDQTYEFINKNANYPEIVAKAVGFASEIENSVN